MLAVSVASCDGGGTVEFALGRVGTLSVVRFFAMGSLRLLSGRTAALSILPAATGGLLLSTLSFGGTAIRVVFTGSEVRVLSR